MRQKRCKSPDRSSWIACSMSLSKSLVAESGVKRNIPGRCGNALPVNRTPGWRDVGWDASDLGGEGTAGGPQGRGPEPAGDRGAAPAGRPPEQPRGAPPTPPP